MNAGRCELSGKTVPYAHGTLMNLKVARVCDGTPQVLPRQAPDMVLGGKFQVLGDQLPPSVQTRMRVGRT